MERLKIFLNRWWVVIVLLVFVPVLYINMQQNRADHFNIGFFTFWLAGKMIWTGGHPYSSAEWIDGHHANGVVWIPNKIFPYPLPLTLLMAPLGLLAIGQAFFWWGFFSQAVITIVVLYLARLWDGLNRQLFSIFILIAILFNNNIKLMLGTGSIGALFLAFLAIAFYLQHKNSPFAAGVVLALMMLKPTFITIIAPIGLWLLFQRNWKMIGGIITGGLGIFVVGLIQDVNWVSKFRGASENLFSMRVGGQPTIISYTRLACGGEMTCAFAAYIGIVLILIGLYALLIWKKHNSLTPLTVFSAAIPLGVLIPPYIWSYDYVLLVIPLCYICMDLIRRTSSYILSILFLFVLDALSLYVTFLFSSNPESPALTMQRDMWSIMVCLIILIPAWAMIFISKREAAVSETPRPVA